ncbi:6-carboxytetrahydropterin synthase [Aestuariibacter sp. A3R04]|uniref:6-carboxytetrahydropterin synthase n=1 Tax=Aestuariibacter sp. A3R04 TaxID=2841571 RepID=UPI001C086603|nr:6-carboxytetrahydropterin synthase [Aestuariibacter sp. A3R04]MBU3022952.1 6-carboxytetrahydropterin synthase [Aestuariibacter sp. A3R04]
MQLFVNDLTVMDFSYLCPKRGMVGESWIVDVILSGDLNDESMIQDFGKVKKNLKRLIDDYVDHKLLIPADYGSVEIVHLGDEEMVDVAFHCIDGRLFQLYSPAEAYAFIYGESVTMDSVGRYLKEVIATHLPENVDNLLLNLRTEVIESPYYHYTHGLKKHDGNCQRIAHGHRSRIDVFHNGDINPARQRYWASRWQDIYIASREDSIDVAQRKASGSVPQDRPYACYAYEASQGYFEITLPEDSCEVITTDSTVECLAEYIYKQEKLASPEAEIKVLAYEGVGKGALMCD